MGGFDAYLVEEDDLLSELFVLDDSLDDVEAVQSVKDEFLGVVGLVDCKGVSVGGLSRRDGAVVDQLGVVFGLEESSLGVGQGVDFEFLVDVLLFDDLRQKEDQFLLVEALVDSLVEPLVSDASDFGELVDFGSVLGCLFGDSESVVDSLEREGHQRDRGQVGVLHVLVRGQGLFVQKLLLKGVADVGDRLSLLGLRKVKNGVFFSVVSHSFSFELVGGGVGFEEVDFRLGLLDVKVGSQRFWFLRFIDKS